jgi:hypothetical protein
VRSEGIIGQVRGMKVRSSVKKLCEGCKVCLFPSIGCRGRWTEGEAGLLGLGIERERVIGSGNREDEANGSTEC